MPGIKKIFTKSVKATSMIEVVVAMVIVMIIFSIGMKVYFNVLRSSYSLQQLNASFLINDMAKMTKENKSYFDEDIETETWNVHKRVSQYEGMDNLILIEYEVLNKDSTKLAEKRELIIKKENE